MLSVLCYSQDSLQSEKKKLVFIMAGASVGNFSNGAGSKFNEIYSNRTLMKNFCAGFGSREIVLIGKYHEFTATGASIPVNVAVTGKAEWKQKFYAFGLRTRGDDHPLYAELLYVITRAEESISTLDPNVEELSKQYTTENRGIGATVGIALRLAGMLGIFAEAEYTTMMKRGRNQYGQANPELGGMNFNAGIQLAI